MRAPALVLSAACALLLTARSAPAAETTATLTLDALSYVSFQDLRTLPLPSGSTLTFRFGEPRDSGEIPFTIPAEGVEIPPVAVGSGETTLRYRLRKPASGVLERADDGTLRMEFTAELAATLSGTRDDGTKRYTVRFTTEEASARSLVGDGRVAVQGARVPEDARYVQLVGATPNSRTAYPEPGRAVYAVLSGEFDQLPALP